MPKITVEIELTDDEVIEINKIPLGLLLTCCQLTFRDEQEKELEQMILAAKPIAKKLWQAVKTKCP